MASQVSHNLKKFEQETSKNLTGHEFCLPTNDILLFMTTGQYFRHNTYTLNQCKHSTPILQAEVHCSRCSMLLKPNVKKTYVEPLK